MALTSLLHSGLKPVIAVVHLPRLSTSPDYVVEYAVSEAKRVEEAGADAVILENYGDTPYPASRLNRFELAVLTVAVREAKRALAIPVGVNALRNSALDALAAAYAANADFVRVNSYCEVRESPEGLLEPVARALEEARSRLPRRVDVLADIDVKHSLPLGSGYDPVQRASECIERGRPDAVVVTGHATGEAPAPGYVAALRKSVEPIPVLLGSGLRAENLRLYWNLVDGFIVGTSVKRYARTVNRVDVERLRRLVEAVRELRRRGG